MWLRAASQHSLTQFQHLRLILPLTAGTAVHVRFVSEKAVAMIYRGTSWLIDKQSDQSRGAPTSWRRLSRGPNQRRLRVSAVRGRKSGKGPSWLSAATFLHTITHIAMQQMTTTSEGTQRVVSNRYNSKLHLTDCCANKEKLPQINIFSVGKTRILPATVRPCQFMTG